MPCRGFEQWASNNSNNRLQREPLHKFSNFAIGIDASTYLKTFTENDQAREPLVAAIGGLPFTVSATIKDHLEKLKSVNITPIFVFNGLSLPSNEEPFSRVDNSVMSRSRAWAAYEEGNAQESLEAFRQAEGAHHTDLERMLMDICNEMDIEFLVAPYLAVAQLAYLYNLKETRYIDLCWAPTEIFLWDVDKAITEIIFSPRGAPALDIGMVTTLNKMQALADLQISQYVFIDACLLSGSSLLEAFPPLEVNPVGPQAPPPVAIFQKAVDLVVRFQNATKTIRNFPDTNAQGYLAKYQKVRAAVQWHPIINEDGEVVSICPKDIPDDVIEFIGPRLPEELYFYVSKGVVSVRAVDMLASGNLIVKAPLDGGEGEFRKFLDKLNPIRNQTMSLIAQNMNRWWYGRTVNVHYWFDKMLPRSLVVKEAVPRPYDLTKGWHVKEDAFKSRLEKLDRIKPVSFTSALQLLTDTDFAKSTITKRDENNLLKTADEIHLNTIWRFLQLRGYIDQTTHELTAWGKALQSALASVTEYEELDEAILLGFELIREGVIKVDQLPTPPEKQIEDAPSADELKLFLGVSKIASLASFTNRNTGYAGPLAKANITFVSFANALGGVLRDLFEGLLISMLLHHETERGERENWYELSNATPFKTPINSATGIAVYQYLQMLGPKESKEDQDAVKRELNGYFMTAQDFAWDLQRGFSTWSAIVRGLVDQKESNLVHNLEKLRAVDGWLLNKQ